MLLENFTRGGDNFSKNKLLSQKLHTLGTPNINDVFYNGSGFREQINLKTNKNKDKTNLAICTGAYTYNSEGEQLNKFTKFYYHRFNKRRFLTGSIAINQVFTSDIDQRLNFTFSIINSSDYNKLQACKIASLMVEVYRLDSSGAIDQATKIDFTAYQIDYDNKKPLTFSFPFDFEENVSYTFNIIAEAPTGQELGNDGSLLIYGIELSNIAGDIPQLCTLSETVQEIVRDLENFETIYKHYITWEI